MTKSKAWKATKNPVLRVTFGIVALTVSLLLIAQVLGFLPDRSSLELEAREKFCESLAVQLSWAASRNDIRSVQNTLSSVVARNDELLSAAIRSSQNTIKASEGDHSKYWVPNESGKSTLEGETGWALLTRSSYSAVFFIIVVGFGFYFLFLRRALKELDPSAVIPERVKAAFDVLAEGLLIVDNDGSIVLANRAFSELTGLDADSLTGRDASRLDRQSPGSVSVGIGHP